jgi:PA14 domain/Glycosyl hydrolase family 63 C-terminal domain
MIASRFLATSILLASGAAFPVALCAAPTEHAVKIGNYFVDSPYGIAIIVDDATGFLIDPVCDEENMKSRYFPNDPALTPPGTTSPDFTFSLVTFHHDGASIRFTWGRAGDGGVVGMFETDRKVALTLRLPGNTWPQFHAVYTATSDGLEGYGVEPAGKFVPFAFRAAPAPALVRANITFHGDIVLNLDPQTPTRFVAGVGALASLDSVQSTLAAAEKRYAASRISAQGDWGDFLGAVGDNLNNSRLYASDNQRVTHAIGRGWWMGKNPDLAPYFVWDYFFDSLLASLEDPAGGRNTIRGVLSFQTPDGRVPSFSHWNAEGDTYDTLHRSMPPVGALVVWKMQERHPDNVFMAEVFPSLVRWHEWWMKARDGNHNGLLEWGSEQHFWQGAQYETGWDDNLAFQNTMLVGNTMNADAVDLSSMWAMDAEYLARIATALGKTSDAQRFEAEQAAMNQRINDRLWNEQLGIYCSRYWDVPSVESSALPAGAIFKNGFDIHYYSDPGLLREAAQHHDAQLDYNWGEASPAENIPAAGWSARVTGTLTAADSGTYRLKVSGGDFTRMSIAGKPVENWMTDNKEQHVFDLKVENGKSYPIVVEYFRNATGKAELRLSVYQLTPGAAGSDWITRLTPMNFYPLTAGAADKVRAEKTLAWMYREDKFWLPWILPTLAKDDPAWPEQEYWHGHIWAPANYIIWQGVQKYADAAHQAEFARRCVALYMRNWTEKRLNCETYKSTDGSCDDEPHYSWGALLDLIGMESLAAVGPDFHPAPKSDSAVKENIVLRNVPFGGKVYRIDARNGNITASEEQAHEGAQK